VPNVTGGARDTFGGSAQAGGNTSGGRSAAADAGRAAAGVVKGRSYPGYAGPTVINGADPTVNAPSYGLSSAETKLYNDAKMARYNRGIGARIFDFFSPVKSVDPQINQPASYAGGTYHYGFNPVGLAVGMAAPYGSGTILGPAAGSLYNSMGGHDVVLTGPGSGFSTSYPDGGPGYNSKTGYGGPNTPGADPQGKGSQSGTQAPHIAGPVQPPSLGLTPSAPKPTPQAPQTPFIFPQPTQSYYGIPGGSPYGVNLFGRTA